MPRSWLTMDICYTPNMINEIDTILKKFDEEWSDAGQKYPNRKARIKTLFAYHLTKLLQSLIVDLEGEKKPYTEDFECGGCGICEACFIQNDESVELINEGLNLTN